MAGTAGTLTTSDGTYTWGFNQVTSINQDAFITFTPAATSTLSGWTKIYANSPADERADFVARNPVDGTLWAVFRTDGGNANFATQAVQGTPFSGAAFPSYGAGGGPAASVLARLDPATGNIVDATYIYARLDNGKTNSLVVREINFEANGQVVLVVNSYYRPPAAGSTQATWTSFTDAELATRHNQGGYAVRLVLDPTLSTIVSSSILPSNYVYGTSGELIADGSTGTNGGATSPSITPVALPTVTSFTTLRARGFGELVDRQIQRGNTSAETLFNAVLSLDPAVRGAALERMAGLDHAQGLRDAVTMERPHGDAITSRLRGRQSGAEGGGIDMSRFALAGDAEQLPGGPVRSYAPVQRQGLPARDGVGLYIRGTFDGQRREDRLNRIGATTHGWSMTVGVDNTFGEGLTAGVAYGYSDGRTRLSGGIGRFNTRLHEIMAYASRNFANGIYVDGMAGFGTGTLESERDVLGETATGNARLTAGHARIAVGQVINNVQRVFAGAPAGLFVIPEVSLRYDAMQVGSWNEVGATDANLRWNSRTYSGLTGEASATFGVRTALNGGIGSVWARIGVAHRWEVDDSTATATLTSAPSDSFEVATSAARPTTLRLGAGATFDTGRGWVFGVDADTRLSDGANTYRFNMRAGLRF